MMLKYGSMIYLGSVYMFCTTIHRYPIFSTRYSVMCKVYTGYCGTSEIDHGLCACTIDNPLAKARGLSLRTSAQTMLYLSLRETVRSCHAQFLAITPISSVRGRKIATYFTKHAIEISWVLVLAAKFK